MSESSTETESLSGGEEEMAMMSITDVFPVGKNMDKVVRCEKVPGTFAKDELVAQSVNRSGELEANQAAKEINEEGMMGSARIGGKKEVIVARAKGFLSHNGVADAAGKKAGIARCEGEPGKDFASAELPVEKETKFLTLQGQMMILRKEQCRLMKERERRVNEGETTASDESKLADARARLERAKHNREQLGLHYKRKEALAAEQGATLEVYRQLKDEYFGFVRQAGELDLQLKEMEEDLNSAHNALGRRERELWATEDKNGPRRKAANPWQVGVPYGSRRLGR